MFSKLCRICAIILAVQFLLLQGASAEERQSQTGVLDFSALSTSEQTQVINVALDSIFQYYSGQGEVEVTSCMQAAFLERPVEVPDNGYRIVLVNSLRALELPLEEQPTIERVVLGVVLAECVDG